MKALVDLNVIMDFLQDRAPFAQDAERICMNADNAYFVAAHMVTTAFYLARPYGADAQNRTLDFLLNTFNVVPCDHAILSAARSLGFADFEDAVVAMAAKKAGCKYIITRNQRDFTSSPVPAVTPGEFLSL